MGRKSKWAQLPEGEEALEYYAQGHTLRETAEKYGISEGLLSNVASRKHISNGRDFHKAGCLAARENLRKGRERQQEIAHQKRVQRLLKLGFDYVSDVGEGKNRKGRVRCQTCGHVFEKSIRHLTNGNVICSECVRLEKEEKERIRKAEIEERKKQKEVERFQKNPLGLSYYQLEKEQKLDEVFVCKECGREYTPRQYMKSCGIQSYSNIGFCSYACRRRAYLRKQHKAGFRNHRHRAHKYGCDYDSSVTLKKLIKRDGLRCGICGRMCNPFDNTWTDHFGASSPTLDHIIPLAKGGSHTWDNVQVAHAICNSKKRDVIEEVEVSGAV